MHLNRLHDSKKRLHDSKNRLHITKRASKETKSDIFSKNRTCQIQHFPTSSPRGRCIKIPPHFSPFSSGFCPFSRQKKAFPPLFGRLQGGHFQGKSGEYSTISHPMIFHTIHYQQVTERE
jgi:hypothetical protein